MYFWLKILHIAAMTMWFTGLLFLPRVFVVQSQRGAGHDELNALGKTLYFGVMTPAGAITIVLGTALIGFGFQGYWLPLKLCLVAAAVLLHLYIGQLLFDLSRGRARHGSYIYRVLNWSPLLLLLGLAALSGAKPGAPGLLQGL